MGPEPVGPIQVGNLCYIFLEGWNLQTSLDTHLEALLQCSTHYLSIFLYGAPPHSPPLEDILKIGIPENSIAEQMTGRSQANSTRELISQPVDAWTSGPRWSGRSTISGMPDL
jgi:hypothetical protein